MRAQVPTEQLGDCRTGTSSSSAPCQTYSSVHTRQSRQACLLYSSVHTRQSRQACLLYSSVHTIRQSTLDRAGKLASERVRLAALHLVKLIRQSTLDRVYSSVHTRQSRQACLLYSSVHTIRQSTLDRAGKLASEWVRLAALHLVKLIRQSTLDRVAALSVLHIVRRFCHILYWYVLETFGGNIRFFKGCTRTTSFLETFGGNIRFFKGCTRTKLPRL
jgi:uncharacterized protein YbdZ (MbtH family)